MYDNIAQYTGSLSPPNLDDIKYHTDTRVYWVSPIIEHFPKTEYIFGRWVWIIYDGPPDRKKPIEPEDGIQETETSNNPKPQQQIIAETPIEDMPPAPTIDDQTEQSPSPTVIAETPLNNMPQAQDESNNDPKIGTKTDTTNPTSHPVMELTIDEFPSLPSIEALPESHTQDSPTVDGF